MRILHRRLVPARYLAVFAFAGAVAAIAPSGELRGREGLDVPYVPTPEAVVDKMLEVGEVDKDDFLIDLGSGDGRIPITAAKRFGTRGMGVDLDPVRIAEAKANAQAAHVTDKVEFIERDLFQTDISKATVLTMYLLSSVNRKLRPRILQELKPGTRVVSHSFDMDDWEPDQHEKVDYKSVYLWIVPAHAAGVWQISNKGSEASEFKLTLNQEFQELKGHAQIDGQEVPIQNGHMKGERIHFELAVDGGTPRPYEGIVSNGRIEGEEWQASRESEGPPLSQAAEQN